jgi:hypothetical protein
MSEDGKSILKPAKKSSIAVKKQQIKKKLMEICKILD